MSHDSRPSPARLAVLGAVAVVALVVMITASIAGFKAFNRYQATADAKNRATVAKIKANNDVQVTAIQIKNQEQRVEVAKQQAQIRFENAKGVREAQDEIAKTLTPLYVQFEMTEALKEIAKSGKNSSVVYIPSGANGVPLVSGVQGQPSVTSPEK
ncbi:hypothetical protein ACH419_36625 [Streptomyces bobili]|uniref:hypothetical protein n=1 Tax=Streptomyces bobili TaxID=67280 RepID=UPI0037AA845C